MKTSLFCQLFPAIGLLAVFPSAGQEVTFDAAAGAISAPFVSSNGCISQPMLTEITNGGRAVYTFTLASAGEYAVVAEVHAPDQASNSLYVNMDGEPRDPEMIWDVAVSTAFTEQWVGWRGNGTAVNPQFATNLFQLTTGTHQLVIRGKEPDTQLKRLRIVKQAPALPPARPLPPTGLRIVGGQ